MSELDGNATKTWWWCLVHSTVEGQHGCKNADRLGPYDTEADAARALDRVAERNQAWDDNDEDDADDRGEGDDD